MLPWLNRQEYFLPQTSGSPFAMAHSGSASFPAQEEVRPEGSSRAVKDRDPFPLSSLPSWQLASSSAVSTTATTFQDTSRLDNAPKKKTHCHSQWLSHRVGTPFPERPRQMSPQSHWAGAECVPNPEPITGKKDGINTVDSD